MRTVEMNRALTDPRLREAVGEQLGKPADSSEVSEAIELTMMVRVFHNLGKAGALPRGATMSTELSDAQQQRMRTVMDANSRMRGFDTPTSYEAALRVLVTDHDQNGKLDIDLGQLSASGLLEGSFDGAALEEILQRNAETPIDHRRISNSGDTFFQEQIRGETFRSTDWGDRSTITYDLNDTSRAVQTGLRRTALQGQDARDFTASLADVTKALKKNPATGVERGLELARQFLPTDPQRAEQVISRMIRHAPEPSVARDTLVAGLRELPQGSFNLLVGQAENGNRYYRMQEADGSTTVGRPPDDDISATTDGLTQTLDVSDFSESFGDIADVMAKRSALIREMGLSSDPSIAQMRDYLTGFAQGRSVDAVADKVGELLNAFCVHCGAGSDYGEHAGNAEAIHARAPQDGLGRNIIDCDGFAYTARELISGIRDDSGAPRFETYITDTIRVVGPNFGDGFHALLAVRERSTGDLFVVNNDKTEARRYGVSSTALRDLATAAYFALDEHGYSGDAALRLRLSTEDLFQNSATEYGSDSFTLLISPEDRRAHRE